MKSTYFYIALAGLGLWALSCKPDLDVPAPNTGGLDLSRYVSYGNSLTAGYADGGLYLESQQYSYPNIIAQQMKLAGGGDFEQPLFPADHPDGSGYLYLAGFNGGLPDVKQITEKPGFDPNSLAYTHEIGQDFKTLILIPYQLKDTSKGTPQNLGVPGIRVADVLSHGDIVSPGYGLNNPQGFNPFFERMRPGAQSYVQYSSKSKPTFFTSWLGNNDVLSFALAGGDMNGDGTTDLDGMSDPVTFEANYKLFLDAIKGTNTNLKGLLNNIPDVTTIPNFTTLTVTLAIVQAQATAVYIQTDAGVRKATDEDLIPLSTKAVLGRVDTIDLSGTPTPIPHGFSMANPLRNNEILDKEEVAKAAARTAELNARIAAIADAYGLALWDANSFLVKVKPGAYFEGIKFSSSFISGNAFSLDGVHLTPMGYALAANQMIAAINAKYGSRIPGVSLTHYRGVRFPG